VPPPAPGHERRDDQEAGHTPMITVRAPMITVRAARPSGTAHCALRILREITVRNSLVDRAGEQGRLTPVRAKRTQ
jgi:hypothetical protein